MKIRSPPLLDHARDTGAIGIRAVIFWVRQQQLADRATQRIGTPSAADSSRHSRTSLSASPVENPKSNPRVSTCFGNLSAEAVLRPLETFSTSSISCGSRPAFTPIASASAVIAIAAWDIRLFASLRVCPRPGFSPTKNTLAEMLEDRLHVVECRPRARHHEREGARPRAGDAATDRRVE